MIHYLLSLTDEEGGVLSWKLCKGTKFSSIENVLQLIKDWLDKQEQKPTIFILDNCCSWHEFENDSPFTRVNDGRMTCNAHIWSQHCTVLIDCVRSDILR